MNDTDQMIVIQQGDIDIPDEEMVRLSCFDSPIDEPGLIEHWKQKWVLLYYDQMHLYTRLTLNGSLEKGAIMLAELVRLP